MTFLALKALPIALAMVLWTMLTAYPSFLDRENIVYSINDAVVTGIWVGWPMLLTALLMEICVRKQKHAMPSGGRVCVHFLFGAFMMQLALVGLVNVIATQVILTGSHMREAGMVWVFLPFVMIKLGLLTGTIWLVMCYIGRRLKPS